MHVREEIALRRFARGSTSKRLGPRSVHIHPPIRVGHRGVPRKTATTPAVRAPQVHEAAIRPSFSRAKYLRRSTLNCRDRDHRNLPNRVYTTRRLLLGLQKGVW